jgi:hypothetical protein
VTIEKGAPWGSVQPTPHEVVDSPNEASAAQAIQDGARYVALRSGNLLRALGRHHRTVDLQPNDNCLVLPCDVLQVTLDHSTEVVAVSTVIVGSRWQPRWWVTSGGFLGKLNVAPRAHPNDGLVDALTFKGTSWRTLVAIRRRMQLGDHLPHPQLAMTRASEVQWKSDRPARITIDGKRYGRAAHVQIVVKPDAFSLCMPQ